MNAIEKLNKGAKGNAYMEAIAEYLVGRVKEDKGLADDVMNPQKTMKKCLAYVKEQAREQAEDGVAMIKDEVVYEWAEDYFRMVEPDEDDEPVEVPKKVTKKVVKETPKKAPTKSLMELVAEQMKSIVDDDDEEDEDEEEEPKQMTLMDILDDDEGLAFM